AQQRLVGLSLKLRIAEESSPQAATLLRQAREDLEQALAELREFARGVHPGVLREDGLDSGIDALARRAPFPVVVEGTVGARLPDTIELAAYFFVSEALTNALKHARATSAVVRVGREGDVLSLAVS